MVGVIIFGFVLIGGIELYCWPQRPWKEVLAYLLLLGLAAALSVTIYLVPDLPVPEPLAFLAKLIMRLWQGGGK
ncbi:MAG: hypothetical protein GX979_12425 [Firmicutes bacterium]|nr:hypothetical protein [Bacillota bacterium]